MKMIFDRTQSDVDQAKIIRDTKIKSFEALTESDIEILERGMLTINTLNRIEDKEKVLKDTINAMGYWGHSFNNKTWTSTDVFHLDDFQRIVTAVYYLSNGFFVFSTTPPTPETTDATYDYLTFNDIEKILYDLELMVENVKSRYRECGNYECGQEG